MALMEQGGQRYLRHEYYEVAAATYTVAEMDRMATLHVSYTDTGVVTITISSAWIARSGNIITIKDTGLNASINNIIIETAGAETIEEEADAVINTDGVSLTLQSDGSNLWVI